MKFTHTVTINSIICNELTATFTGVSPFPSSAVSTQTILVLHTYENNGVYLIYSPDSNVFDTIVNLHASIGDKWRSHQIPYGTPSTSCLFSRPVETVVDTGHVIINSQYLKKVVVHSNFTGLNDTIIERITGFNNFFTPNYTCLTDTPPYGSLMCYSDSNFVEYKKPGFATCLYDPTRVKENLMGNTYKIYPIPVSSILHLGLFATSHIKLVLEDIAGREIKCVTTINKETYEMDMIGFEKGIYFLKIFSNEKLCDTQKIIKE